MSIPRHIKEYLDSAQVSYQHSTHSPAYTAQEVAHEQHVSGKQLAKTVMVIADKDLVMAVLPASHRLDLDALKKVLGASKLRLAQEEEFEKVFPGCEVGAMPPWATYTTYPFWSTTHCTPIHHWCSMPAAIPIPSK